MKEKIQQLKCFAISHAYSLLLTTGTIIYGVQLTRYPQILSTFSVYKNVIDFIDYRWIGLIFVTLGVVKMIGLLLNHGRVRRYAIVSLTYAWSFLSLSFLLSSPPNTVWVFSAIMTVLAIITSIRGDFTE